VDRIEFIDSPEFHDPDAESRIVVTLPELVHDRSHAEGDQWGGLTMAVPWTHEQQCSCFRMMNYFKFMANSEPSRFKQHEKRALTVRDALVLSNQRLIPFVLGKRLGKGQTPRQQQERADIVSEAIAALIDAVDRFDFGRQVRFSSFAYTSIEWRLQRNWNVNRTLKRRVNVEAKQFGEDDQGAGLERIIPAKPDTGLSVEDRCLVEHLLKTLETRQRRIVQMYFGLDGEQRTCGEIAGQLKISEQRVYQIINKAMQSLRQAADREASEVKSSRPQLASPVSTGLEETGSVPNWLAGAWCESQGGLDYKALGSDYRERERIGRLGKRWAKDFRARSAVERRAILALLLREGHIANGGLPPVAIRKTEPLTITAIEAAAKSVLDAWLSKLIRKGGFEVDRASTAGAGVAG
jgi:RNA polymerase sigma factor (sigma-70 family)